MKSHARCANAIVSRVIAGALLLTATFAASAGPATYTGEAPVSSQAEMARSAALAVALTNVVTNLTGDTTTVARPDAARAIAEASKQVLQYQYRRSRAADGSQTLTLVADFDAHAVNDVLRRIGLAPAEDDKTAVGWSSSEAKVWINGIRSSEDYARIVRYFSGLELVRSAAPIESRGDGLLMQLSLNTDFNRFLAAVQAGSTLSVVDSKASTDGAEASFVIARH